jgi:hypothetical protein
MMDLDMRGKPADPHDALVLGPSRTDGKTMTTAHRDVVIGVRVNRGCFSGTLDDFIALIAPYAKTNTAMVAQAYEFVDAIRAHFGLAE